MADALIPGLPHELALLCFSKLPLHAVAQCRAVSRSWATALLHYPAASRLPQSLACICVSDSKGSSMAWLLFSRSDPGCRIVPLFDVRTSHTEQIHIWSSQMQVVTTGTNLLLVRSRLTFTGEPETGTGNSIQCVDPCHEQPGLLQAFDLWQMKWCKEAGHGMHVHPMHVGRWGFATAQIEEHVYVAGGEGDSLAARSAERLNVKTGEWEMLPEMIKERSADPAGFAMGGCFYVVGGEFQPTTDAVGRTQSGEFYDPEKGMWELVPDMWPAELWCFGEVPHVVVVNEEAYAIVDGFEVLRWRVNGGWEKAGCLPYGHKVESLEYWFFRLVSVEKDKLWVVLVSGEKDEEHPWLVFSCEPYQSNDGLVWDLLPFAISFSPWKGIVTSAGVYV